MKVLHLGKYSLDAPGGIEAVQNLHSRYLSSKVDWFSINFSTDKKIERNPLSISFPCVRLLSQPFSIKYFIFAIFSFSKFDVIHLHAPNLLGLLASLFAPRRKLIIHWHSDILDKGIFHRLIFRFESFLVYRAAAVVFTSESYRSASYIKHDHSHVIPLSVEPSCKTVPNSNVRIEKVLGDKRDFNFLTIGRLVDYKNHFDLVKQFSGLPSNWYLHIVGDGPNFSLLKQCIHDFDLNERVFLHGYVNRNDLQKLFDVSDCFVLWSNTRAEAFGLVLLEAYSNGIPLIIYENTGSGMLDIAAQTQFSVLSDDLLDDKSRIERMVSNVDRDKIINDFLDRFSPEVEINSWLELYKEIIDGSH